jgi:glutamate synthase (NADPH/NADH) large chain
MAKLGIRTVDELVGRSDLLQVREKLNTHRAETLDLHAILLQSLRRDHVPHFDPADVYDFHLERTADMRVLHEEAGPLWRGKKSGSPGAAGLLHRPGLRHPLRLRDHPAVCRRHPAGRQLCHHLHGRGGQSFGAFHSQGPDAAAGGRLQRRLWARASPAAS